MLSRRALRRTTSSYSFTTTLNKECDGPALFKLPPEVFAQIMEELGDTDKLCIALTCRATFSDGVFENLVQPPFAFKKRILVRLERDVPRHSYCPVRDILVPFSRQHLPKNPLRYHNCAAGRLPVSRRGGDRVLTSAHSSRFELSFCTARLVTNGHRYSLRHGLPASAVSLEHSHVVKGLQFHVRESWTASVNSSHELILSCVRSWTAPCAILKHTSATDRIRMCYHSVSEATADDRGRQYVIGDREHRSTGRCHSCDTAWEIEIGPAALDEEADSRTSVGQQKWKIIATTHQNAGTCREPADVKWRTLML
ncbi:hypothetical protein Micbo1qcDRAFT_178098 [Microdochium bolleyi]|uniref:F-box domain-containing protein n=1 Tax=Microdochium bolleyi TaxID=196109 RepID=A0A136IUJ0_9PEZI|nr:hypothetical protein Micbo1qcDRAFT_178098 [Microdochium bolleyi]